MIPTPSRGARFTTSTAVPFEDSIEYLKYITGQENISADEESLNLIAQKDGGRSRRPVEYDKAVCSSAARRCDYRNVAQTLNVLDYDTYSERYGDAARR